MEKLTRILVPVEFSPRCSGAAHYAEALATHFHSEIVLLHVVGPVAPLYGSAEALAYSSIGDLTADRKAQRQSLLDAFLADELDGIAVRRVLVEDDPAGAIVQYARDESCDLIVMPTHGYGPFRRFLLGSVTAKVLHDASCPVWTGPHMEQAPVRDAIHFRKVMCAVDFGHDTRPVLNWGAGFAREFGATLAVVHAIPLSTVRLGPVFFDPEWRAHVAHTARERIDFYLQDLRIQGEVSIEIGDVPAAVSEAAKRWSADLLVIGRGHAPGLMGRLRTNAYAILRESPCPVAAI